MAVKSGIFWVTWANAHAQNSSKIEHLVEPFRSQAIAFIKALHDAGWNISRRSVFSSNT